MNKAAMLKVIPRYEGTAVLIEDDQEVRDIVHEVCEAHKFFAPHYDQLAPFFWTGNIYDTCEALFNFCKSAVRYKIESVDEQTTKSPAAFLTQGYGDCKHYAGFIAGVLDAINRMFGQDIKWQYRFASYDPFNDIPQHVFVVARDREGEIWIDPVLKSFDDHREPSYYVNKKVSGMSLSRISGINDELYGYTTPRAAIGWTVETSTGFTKSGATIEPKMGHPFFGEDFLGLTRYGFPSNTDVAKLRGQLQEVIAKSSPKPYTLSQGMVDKVLRDNVQNWNFLYENGTSPKPRDWENFQPFKDYISLLLTPDGRLTFDREGEPAHDWPYIHYLVDWANYLVQNYSDQPYIVLIDHLKRLGKGWKTPQEGNLWALIHTGDVNAAKITEMAGKIPGLNQFLSTFGVNMASLLKFAKSVTGAVTGGGGATGLPNNNTPPPAQTAGMSTGVMVALGLAAVYFISKPKRKVAGTKNDFPWLLIGGGLLTLSLLKKQTGVFNPPDNGGGIVPPTATPPYAEEMQTGGYKSPVLKTEVVNEAKQADRDQLIQEYSDFYKNQE